MFLPALRMVQLAWPEPVADSYGSGDLFVKLRQKDIRFERVDNDVFSVLKISLPSHFGSQEIETLTVWLP